MCCLVCGFARGQQDSLEKYMWQVTKPATDTARTQAIDWLMVQQNPKVLPFLAAVQQSALYTWKNKLVTAVKNPARPAMLELHLLYPNYTPVLNDANEPLAVPEQEIQAVTISRAERMQTAALNTTLNLFNLNPAVRVSAYNELAQAEENSEALLAWALRHEQDEKVLAAGKEAYYYMELNKATSKQAQQAWADSLYESGSNSAMLLLRKFAKQPTLDQEVSSHLIAKANKLETMATWAQRIQNAFSGVSLASILILISLGLGIVYGLAGIINMAHGEFLMIGAYATFSIQILFTDILGIQSSDWFFLAALPLSFIVAGFAGLLLERLVVRHLYAKPLDSLLATWGVSLILIQLARWLFGDMTAVKLPALLSGGISISPQLVLPYNRLFIICLTISMVIAVYWVLMRTRLGLQIRAVTQNRNMSACLGINTKRMNAITFFLGSGLAGLAGCAMTLIGNVVPDMGQSYIVDSFLMVVIGGVGKIVGIVVSGLGIGISSKVLEAFFEAVYGKVTILFIIMIFMQFRPKGLFPDKGRSAEE